MLSSLTAFVHKISNSDLENSAVLGSLFGPTTRRIKGEDSIILTNNTLNLRKDAVV
jgi:hypothetical protein